MAADGRHSTQTSNHILENWTYADAATRAAATGFVAADIGKVAYQTDTGIYYRLTATTPTWVAIGAAGSVANPTATIGLVAVNGVASSAIRSDGAPALSVSISPTWSGTHTFSNTIVGSVSGNAATATALTSRTLWGQSFDGTGNVTGSLTAVGDITGGASNMTITAGTGNSRTLILKTTTSGGTATTFLTGNADQSATFAGAVTCTQETITQTIATSGSPTALTVTGAAHTTLTASTEAIDLNFNLARSVQWATGNITTQRFVVFQAPTMTAVGSSTTTTAATVAITGAPVAGSLMAITSAKALWVQSGTTTLSGNVEMGASGTTTYFGGTANDTQYNGLITTNSSLGGQLTIEHNVGSGLGYNPRGRLFFCRDAPSYLSVISGGVYNTLTLSSSFSFYPSVGSLGAQTAALLAFSIGSAGTTCLSTAIGNIAFTVTAIASRTVQLQQFQTSAGGSLGNVSGGCIGDVFADVSTTHTDGTFDTLRTDTTVANALIVNGDKIYFDYTLTTVSSVTAARDFKLAFAGITIFDSTGLVFGSGAGSIRITGYIIRKTSTTARATIDFRASGNATIQAFSGVTYVPDSTLTGLTLTGTNALVLSAAASGTGAASADISLVSATIHIDGFGS